MPIYHERGFSLSFEEHFIVTDSIYECLLLNSEASEIYPYVLSKIASFLHMTLQALFLS